MGCHHKKKYRLVSRYSCLWSKCFKQPVRGAGLQVCLQRALAWAQSVLLTGCRGSALFGPGTHMPIGVVSPCGAVLRGAWATPTEEAKVRSRLVADSQVSQPNSTIAELEVVGYIFWYLKARGFLFHNGSLTFSKKPSTQDFPSAPGLRVDWNLQWQWALTRLLIGQFGGGRRRCIFKSECCSAIFFRPTRLVSCSGPSLV